MERVTLVCEYHLTYFTNGRGYVVLNTGEDGDSYLIMDDEGGKVWVDSDMVKHCFRVVHFTDC